MGKSGADVARELLAQGERPNIDGWAQLLDGCELMGALVGFILEAEGHTIDREGVSKLVAQEVYSAALDGARAAVCGVIA